MKKRKEIPKRILTFILSLAMLIGLMPATALAANSAEASDTPITFVYYSQATLDSTNPDQVKAAANTVKFTINLLDENGYLTTTAIPDGATIPDSYTSNSSVVQISELLSQISVPGYTLEDSYAFFFWSGNTSVSQGLNLSNAGAHKITTFKNFAEVSDRYGDGSATMGTTSTSNTYGTIGYTMTELNGTTMKGTDWTNDTDGYYAYEYGGVLHIVLMPVSQATAYKTRYINYAETDDTLVDTTDAHDMTYTSTTSGTTWSGYLTLTTITESDLTSPGSDYVFEGWYFDCDENGNGTGTKVGGDEVMYSDNTVYARWVKKYEATSESYVYDYAKTMTVTLTLTNSNEYLSLHDNTASTDTVKNVTFSQNDNTTISGTYGTATVSEDSLSYTPTTMSPDVDTFNVTLTDTENVTVTKSVNFIPANSVYYEDDFVTTESTGVVGIVYTGTTGTWTTVGESSGNTETVDGSTYGWETSLNDDTTYSDGSAHVSSTDGATATFTFTGTGVDVYSRTTSTTGTVYAKLTRTETDEDENTVTVVTKRLIVDNLAESNNKDGYYQIPTVSFSDLDYGTYTVTLTVTTAADGRSTYYLDGIRVYNPLGTVTEDDGAAYEAYAEDNELNAVFTEIRDILIDANSFTDGYNGYDGDGGAVFIDNIPATEGTGETTTAIGTYVDYGPKNEVYLAAGQSIAFKVEDGDNYYLGIKAPAGATTATITNGTGTSGLSINAASDLYYEITPTSDGYIMVKNSGSNLLSITKLRSTSTASTESGIALLSTEDVNAIMLYAASFDSLETVDYTAEGTDAEEFDSDDDSDITEDSEDEDEDDVVIENPSEDTENQPENVPAKNNPQSIFSKLLTTIRNWFNGRR